MSAKWRPVAAPPEQRLIPTMRGDVVDHGCGLHLAGRLAHHTQRVLSQELGSGLLPLVAIAPLCRCLLAGAPATGLHGREWARVQHWNLASERLEFGHTDPRSAGKWSRRNI